MWAGDRNSRRFPCFHKARYFSVHVLSAEQTEPCFGCSKDAFALRDIDHDHRENGTPSLRGCLARFKCEQHASHDADDHVIVVGKVLRGRMADGDALAFHTSKLGQFARQ